jgi:hypothetical protein
VTKTVFIDLLDPSYQVNATQTIRDVIAEKIEGLASGPDLEDGRHLLYVISDNDLYPGRPTQIFAFAIDRGEHQCCAAAVLRPDVPARTGEEGASTAAVVDDHARRLGH